MWAGAVALMVALAVLSAVGIDGEWLIGSALVVVLLIAVRARLREFDGADLGGPTMTGDSPSFRVN